MKKKLLYSLFGSLLILQCNGFLPSKALVNQMDRHNLETIQMIDFDLPMIEFYSEPETPTTPDLNIQTYESTAFPDTNRQELAIPETPTLTAQSLDIEEIEPIDSDLTLNGNTTEPQISRHSVAEIGSIRRIVGDRPVYIYRGTENIRNAPWVIFEVTERQNYFVCYQPHNPFSQRERANVIHNVEMLNNVFPPCRFDDLSFQRGQVTYVY